MNFCKSLGRQSIPSRLLRFIPVVLLLSYGCGGHRSANKGAPQSPSGHLVPSRVFYSANRDFDCYSEQRGGFRREQLKVGQIPDDRELAVLAALFNDVVAPDLTIEGNSRQKPRFIVSLATQDEHDIAPTDQFLESIESEGFQVLAHRDSLQQLPDCELRLWAWIADDSASVEAIVWSSYQSRSALVFWENGRWKACGSDVIGQLNLILVPKAKWR